ncbi:MAG: HEAT repeat domain-containing protein [Planctomycetes bacterium]|nr:HEAT repeat domain-containing protein [Planctomycetota bacterium]
MRTKLFAVLIVLAGLAMLGTGCSSTPSESGDGAAADREYIDDDTLEAFDRDFRSLSMAIARVNEDEERSMRTKISESARLYQKALISALYDDSSQARRTLAAVMLGFTGDASVVSLLVDKVQDEDEPESVRLNAILGLATLGDKLRDYEKHGELMKTFSAQMRSKEASFSMRRAAIMAYAVAFDGAQSDSILPLRDSFLSDGDVRVQIAAINAMGDIGDTNAVPDLAVVGLDHPDSDIRAASAVALGKIADPTRVLPALENACMDENALVRRQSIDAISKQYGSDPERVFAVIVTGLSDFDARVREAAALALARIDDARAIDSLLQATGDRTAMVRQAAAESLGKLITADREKEAFPLVDMLGDQNPGVKGAALASLTGITKKDFGSEQPRWEKYFYEKYPDLDPANMYAGGPKPRVSSGISNSGSRRTTSSSSSRTQPRNTSSRTNSSRNNGRNNTRTNNTGRTR